MLYSTIIFKIARSLEGSKILDSISTAKQQFIPVTTESQVFGENETVQR